MSLSALNRLRNWLPKINNQSLNYMLQTIGRTRLIEANEINDLKDAIVYLADNMSEPTPAITNLNQIPTRLFSDLQEIPTDLDDFLNESNNPFVRYSEIDHQLQRYWYSIMANTLNTTLIQVNNTNSFTTAGTVSVVARSGTTYYNSIAMNNYLSAIANGSNCGIKNNNQGDGSYLEGFDSSFVFINNDININCETTVGYYGLLSAIPNIAKSAYTTDFVGVGNDVGDTNLSFFCKRNTETQSYNKVDCGESFPAHSTTDAYILRMQMSRGFNGSGRTLQMTITNIITSASFTYTFTDEQIPSHTRNIAMVVNRSNRNTGVATNIRFSKFHQTKYIY